MARYLEVLKAEIRLRAAGRAETVYIGGGTPSLCTPGQIRNLLAELSQRMVIASEAEITLEVNPATADRDKLKDFRDGGINRLSVGVQSTSDFWLCCLERPHTAAQTEALIRDARDAGFRNLSCDLMYGLPGQTEDDFRDDLNTLLAWQPDHLSLYSLSVEAGTRLAARISGRELPEPDEDAAADMYIWAQELLGKKGFFQYELSNFAQRGHMCRHNLGYWTQRSYWGFGLAAHSYRNGIRSWNFGDADSYFQALTQDKIPREGEEKLKDFKKIAEQLIVGLRLTSGVRKRQLARRFGPDWAKPFEPAFQALIQDGLLQEQSETLQLTPRGMLLANVVFRALI